MKKTAAMFAGVDALDAKESRLSVLKNAHVLARLRQAQAFLDQRTEGGLLLEEFVAAEDKAFHANLPLKAFVAAVVQVGIFDHYCENNPKPDLLIGCSLGDTARTVCSGTLSFEEMIYGTYLFNKVGQTITGGSIIRVRKNDGPLTFEDVQEIENHGVKIVVHQTPRHFLVSGEVGAVAQWALNAVKEQRYIIRPLYDKPLHTSLMSPALHAVKTACAASEMRPWRIPMYSSVHRKVITTIEELKADIEDNMIGPVYWWQSFTDIVENLGVTKIVNIGPASTLMLFAERIELKNPVEMIDALAPVQEARSILIS